MHNIFKFMAQVKLHNVWKTYAGEHGQTVTAVRDFNLDIADREFVVFVGPSGCGKSTTLRMIAGLEEISAGQISIDGRVVNDVLPKDRDIAMVFQNYALYPHMTVFENMAFGLKLQRMPRPAIKDRVEEAAAILGIEALLDRKPKALSGGQRQRVAVGRAIVRKPKVFLFDEPLSNLDAQMRVQMRAEIAKLHQRLQATMIYVTHDQAEAMTMGTRIVVMKDGLIQQVDEPLRIYHEPANNFVARFLGSPPMNLFDGLLERRGESLIFQESQSHFELNLGTGVLPASEIGNRVTLGVRPEHCRIVDASSQAAGLFFKATVELVEAMGPETFFYARIGKHLVIARAQSEGNRSILGREVLFGFDESKLHFFDGASGSNFKLRKP